jgi:tetratricopeptide (TPR) repeat protein
VGLAVLAALTLVFPLIGTPSRVAYRFPVNPAPTLDGLAFLETGTFSLNDQTVSLADEAAAIRWLNREITGTPIVLQSSLEFYRSYGTRVAANTGLPTIVSPLHESEQREPEAVGARDADVIAIYRSPSQEETLRLLSKYKVDYVYFGVVERAAYGEASAEKFNGLSNGYLNPVYQNQSVTIYAVNQAVRSFPPLVPLPERGDPSAALRPLVPPRPLPNLPAAPSAAPQPAVDQATLEQQVAADPTAAGAAFALAELYRNQGDPNRGADVLAPAAAANPGDIGLHHLWGDILRDAGRFDEAEAAYRHAVGQQPNVGNLTKLGQELIRMGRPERAEEALLRAVAVDPQFPDTYYYLGQLYEQQQKGAPAVQNYEQYLLIAPADGALRNGAEEALARLR